MAEQISYYCDKSNCGIAITNYSYDKNEFHVKHVELRKEHCDKVFLCDAHAKEFIDTYLVKG